MVLVEPSATNLLSYSEDFSDPGWTKVYDVVVTPSSVASPDGTTNSFKLSELELTDGDYGLSEFINTTPSTSYTFSAYFKATNDSDVGKKVRIRIRRNAGTSISASESVTLTSEWVRHSVTIDLLSDNTSCWFVVSKDTSSPTAEHAEECLIWGAQAETGSVSTSYIPTSGSTVTRAADDLVISGSAFSSFFNATEGTVYAEFLYDHDETSKYVYSVTETGNNEIRSQILSSSLRNRYVVNSSNVANLEKSGILRGSLNRSAFSYKTDNFRLNLNGTTDSEELSGTASINPIKLAIGSRGTASHLNGRIRRLIYWPVSSERL
jgi:hypothetical protein